MVGLLSVGGLAIGLLAVVGHDTAERAVRSEHVEVAAGPAEIGRPAPDFSAPSVGGEPVKLSEHRGRAVVVTFFASWCYPCRHELPLLEAATRAYGERLRVVAISYGDEPSDTAAFLDGLGLTLPAVVDDGSVAAAYGVITIPATFFIDRHGVVRDRVSGITTAAALADQLDRLLAR